MISEEKQKLDATKLEIRNLQRKLNNAEHTYQSNKSELRYEVYSHAEKHMIKSRERSVAYWKDQIELFEGKIFLICLSSGLNEERAWEK